MLCESEQNITNLAWLKRDGTSWPRIYKSYHNGFQGKWGEVFRLERYNLVTDYVTESLGGVYMCMNQDIIQAISQVILTVLGGWSSYKNKRKYKNVCAFQDKNLSVIMI